MERGPGGQFKPLEVTVDLADQIRNGAKLTRDYVIERGYTDSGHRANGMLRQALRHLWKHYPELAVGCVPSLNGGLSQYRVLITMEDRIAVERRHWGFARRMVGGATRVSENAAANLNQQQRRELSIGVRSEYALCMAKVAEANILMLGMVDPAEKVRFLEQMQRQLEAGNDRDGGPSPD